MKSNEQNQLSTNEAALLHMEQKYGEKFEYVSPSGASYTGTREFMASCESLPGENILVQIENYGQENRIYRDNYLAVKYRQQTIDFLHDRFVEVFGEANIYYNVNPNGLSPDLAADATFEEYLADTRVPLVILAEVKESDFSGEEQAVAVAERLAANTGKYVLTLTVVKDNVYGIYEHDALRKQVSLNQFVRCADIKHPGNGIQIAWREKE